MHHLLLALNTGACFLTGPRIQEPSLNYEQESNKTLFSYLSSSKSIKCSVIALAAYRSTYLQENNCRSKALKCEQYAYAVTLQTKSYREHSRIIISLDNQLRLAAEGGHPQLAHQILVRQVPKKTCDLLLLYFKFIQHQDKANDAVSEKDMGLR